MRWCTGPCGRLLSVVAFRRGDVCGRCRDVTAHAQARGQAALAKHLVWLSSRCVPARVENHRARYGAAHTISPVAMPLTHGRRA
jgi:hypothetical protein